MTKSRLLAAFFVVSIAAGAHGQTPSAEPQGAVATAVAPMTDGEVRKVDKEAEKVTLRHGPIANLDMPGMTMVFKAADPQLLENLKEGDKVRFSADRINGAIAVTRIETVN